MPSDIVQQLIDKTYKELSQKPKPKERSRISNTPNGHIFLIAWSNASLLRVLVRKYSDSLTKSEHRLKAQVDDAARSVVANIEEGFARPTTSEYINFLGYSRASLIEVKGDIQRSLQDGFLKSIKGSNLKDLGIDLFEWHEALKKSIISKPKEIKGNYGNLKEFNQPFKFLYNPVDSLNVANLTCEMFIELINKTDWNIRKLVESLEKKLNQDQKAYQIEKMRLKS
jgi:four helix bundle protein